MSLYTCSTLLGSLSILPVMARPLRIERAGSRYPLRARGNERREIYSDDDERLNFLGLLEARVERYRLCRLHAYVLMSKPELCVD